MPTTNAISSTTPVSTLSQSTSLNQNFDSFLRLLTTQLQYQDPLSPLDTNQFTQQLVQFSGVEQSIKTNTNLETLIASVKSSNLSNAATYLGRTVTADTDTLTVQSGGGGTWEYDLVATAANTKISIFNARGVKVYEADGDVRSGPHQFIWDGKDSAGSPVAAGEYRLAVTSTTSGGSDVKTQIGIQGRADSLESSNGINRLIIANTAIDFSKIRRITAN